MSLTIADFAPENKETGVGLVLQDEDKRYIFFIAGKRHHCPPGEIFYAGIGGHREHGESWMECAQREALEEVGVGVEIISSDLTWHIPSGGVGQKVEVPDLPRPYAFYEMIHPPGTPREGCLYRIVIYKARLLALPKRLQREEVSGIIALTKDQVICGPEHKPTLRELIQQGATVLAGKEGLDQEIRLSPLGTADALAKILLFEEETLK
jgi:8-oxo-dGTP pyrophosphatase MutT (NUDIX family)